MPLLVSLTLPLPDGADAPSEFRIWPWGTTQTMKGKVVLDKAAAATLLKAYAEHGIELAIDYEHQTFNSNDNGKEAPAAGWFKPEIREDGLWASDVKWTDKAAAMLKAREYRYFSPTALLDAKTRKPVRLMPMALTNWPATKQIEPLVARADQPQTESFMDELLEALGLKDKAELLSAVTRLVSFERDVLVLSGSKSHAEAVGALTALKTKVDQGDAAVAELAALKESTAQSETKAMLDEAVKDGRIDGPAKRAELEAMQAKYGVDALRMTLSMLRKPAAAAVEPKAEKPAALGMFNASQVELIKKLGLKPEDVAKNRADILRARGITVEEG